MRFVLQAVQSCVCIECYHGGHIGGAKQQNDFPLGNIFLFLCKYLLLFRFSNMAAMNILYPAVKNDNDIQTSRFLVYLTMLTLAS